MKVIVVPDPHQTTHWRKVRDHIDSVDKVIFLGDYFDTWKNKWPHQINNVSNIIKFKKDYPDKVCLCWGNHETSYYLDEKCSGYQHDRSFDIEEFLRKHNELFEVCFIFDNWIFAHGGISKKWIEVCGIDSDINKINQLFKERPGYFRWVGPNGYGNNYNEGPLWIRPIALAEVAIDNYNQCVGHTEVNSMNVKPPIKWKHQNNGDLLLVDSHEHDCIIELDTITGEYKLI